MKKIRRTFSPEFRLEAAQLVVDQKGRYTAHVMCGLFGIHRSNCRAWRDRPRGLLEDECRLREQKRWACLALVLDLFARRPVGGALSLSPDSTLTKKALTMAYESRGNPEGVLFHSDQGCQYTSQAFRQQVWR